MIRAYSGKNVSRFTGLVCHAAMAPYAIPGNAGRIRTAMSSVQRVLIRPETPCWRPTDRKLSMLSKDRSKLGATYFQILTPVAMNRGRGESSKGFQYG